MNKHNINKHIEITDLYFYHEEVYDSLIKKYY